MRYFIQTFGCQMNENDSHIMSSMLNSAGHIACDSVEKADIIIINTCCIRESAENRALGFIGSIKHLKQVNPQLIIAVCGCMVQKDGVAKLFMDKYRHIGIIIGTFASALLPQYIEQYDLDGQRIVDTEERYDRPELSAVYDNFEHNYKAQININFGCNNYCSYCIVPYVRGKERSRQPQEIIDEIKRLADGGIKEIQLLGQNVNSYGKDIPELGWNFARLLTAINDISGLHRIRYMTSHPRDFDRYLAETIASLDKVCDHYHLPVQSGSDRILKLMNRGYTTAEYFSKLSIIRSTAPKATITSDLIVGFPGESDADFAETIAFIKAAGFDAAYTFLYSKRSGTTAANMDGHLSSLVKKQRLQELMDIQNPISLQINQALVGSIQEVMVDGISKNNNNMLCGRTSGNKIVAFAGAGELSSGSLVQIKITEAKTWNLYGQLIEQ